MGRRTTVKTWGCLVAIGLAAPHVARAAVRTVRFGHNNPEPSSLGRGATAFAAAVAADPVLGSILKIDVCPTAQLGDDLNMLNSCMKGAVDGALVGGSLMSDMVP